MTDPSRPTRAAPAPSVPEGADSDASQPVEHTQGAQRSAQAELRHVIERVDGLRARMRTAVDLLGVLLLGLSGAALLVVTVLAVVGFINDDTGIGLLFSALAVVCLPLVAFAGWRAFQPLWQLSRELRSLRGYELKLRARVGPAIPVGERGAGPKVKLTKDVLAERLPPGRSPTGWRQPPPRRNLTSVLSTRQVGWRVVLMIAIVMVLFAAGVLSGILARP
jgi:hypothetical protein